MMEHWKHKFYVQFQLQGYGVGSWVADFSSPVAQKICPLFYAESLTDSSNTSTLYRRICRKSSMKCNLIIKEKTKL